MSSWRIAPIGVPDISTLPAPAVLFDIVDTTQRSNVVARPAHCTRLQGGLSNIVRERVASWSCGVLRYFATTLLRLSDLEGAGGRGGCSIKFLRCPATQPLGLDSNFPDKAT